MASRRIAASERELAAIRHPGWEAAIGAWDARLDLDQARAAAAAFEQIARDDGGADAWAWCARAHYYLGDYAPVDERSALFERGAALGRRGVAADERHVGAAFWTACCLGAHADTLNALRRALAVPEVVRCLLRVQELDPGYYHHGLARFVGQAILRQPLLVEKALAIARPELGADAVLADLRASVEHDPPFVLTLATLGELAWRTRRDRATVDDVLARLGRLDPDAVPNLAPENRRDLPRARQRLEALA